MNKLKGYIKLLEGDEHVTCIRQGRVVPDDVDYVDGLPVATHAFVKFDVQATLQPMGGRDLMMMPEAFRDKDMWVMWQAHRTQTEDVVRVDLTDVILFRGRAYQVQSAEDWESYTKATLCGIDLGAYAGNIDVDNLPVIYPSPPVVVAPVPDPPVVVPPVVTPPVVTPPVVVPPVVTPPVVTPPVVVPPVVTPPVVTPPVVAPTPAPVALIPNPATFYPATEELDMDIGPMLINTLYGAGELHDCLVPGDSSGNAFRYRMPRSGRITGYSVTGIAPAVQFGAYVDVYTAATGATADSTFVDPATRAAYNSLAGDQVIFATPVTLAQGDIAQLKLKIIDGASGQVDVACFFQIILDSVASQAETTTTPTTTTSPTTTAPATTTSSSNDSTSASTPTSGTDSSASTPTSSAGSSASTPSTSTTPTSTTPTSSTTTTPETTEEFMESSCQTYSGTVFKGTFVDLYIPGSPSYRRFEYFFAKAGTCSGFTITGGAADQNDYTIPISFGCQLNQRVAATGNSSNVVVLDPTTQPTYNVNTGVQVVFDSPISCAQGDILRLRLCCTPTSNVNVDLMAVLQLSFA